MKVLVLSQYFSPEGFIINDVVKTLVARGDEVVVATGKPNYPDGNIFPGYRASGVQRERYLDTVDVVRVPLWPRGKGGALNLVLNYISFVISGLLLFPWLLRGREFDAILVYAPSPITQVAPAIPLKWIKKARLALWVQDLWPESLAATGFVRNRFALALVGRLVRLLYSCCDLLLVQSRAFVEPVARYASRDKIVYYPNSVLNEPSANPAVEIPEDLAKALEQSFSVVFAGNLGTAQSVETLLEACKLLKVDPAVRMVLVGSGSRMAWLLEQQKANQLDNLILPGRFPVNAMPEIFGRADVLLVSLKDEEIFAQTIPSKVQAYLAAGRPIAASLRGEGARVVEESGAGESCLPEDPVALAELITNLKNRSPEQLIAMGAAARKYFDEHFEMNSQVERLVTILRTHGKGES